ncbi:MAG TPA: hypothetical protein VKA84_14465 [Gemmatimonadaceae bacterium]|nr:hypothetical protein [Gemmatimonadaceae bacterium]
MRSPVLRRPTAWATSLVLALPALAACGSDGGTPTGSDDGSGSPGIRLVAGAGVTDSVLFQPIQALVVEVRGEAGAPRSGVVVRFDAVPPADELRRAEHSVLVCPLDAQACGMYSSGSFATDTTDALGRAKVLVRLGTVAGPAAVGLFVPELALRDTARFTVTPGSAARVRVSVKDSVAYVGKSWSVSAAVVDRYGNARSDAIAYSANGAVTADAAGRLTTAQVGRGFVVARAGALADTAWASVVPTGTFAALGSSPTEGPGLFVANLDGSGVRRLVSVTNANDGSAPSWSPNGDRIAYHDGPYGRAALFAVTVSTGTVDVLPVTGPTTGMWPKYTRDGAWIYFHGTGSGYYAYHVWRVRPDGTGAESVTPAVESSGIEWRPSPSPDGARVAYVFGDASSPRIRVRTLATGAVSAIDAPGQSPRWSPAGDLIAFVGLDSYSGMGALKVMAPDGSGLRVLTPARFYAPGFDWSPDGRWILARSNQSIDLIEVATGAVLPLPFARGFSQPAWRP